MLTRFALLAFPLGVALAVGGCGGDDDRVINGDWVIDGVTVTEADKTIDVYGNVIVRNGGVLDLSGVTLNVHSNYDLEHAFFLEGNATLKASGSTVRGEGGQTYVEATAAGGASPRLEFTDCVVTNHAGIWCYGATTFYAKGGAVEEVQVHDTARATLDGGEVYAVLFFTHETATLNGLHAGDNVSATVSIPGGWRMDVKNAVVYGWQLDLEVDADVTVNGSSDIVLSVHTPGDLPGEPVVQNLTSNTPTSGTLDTLGPAFTWNNTQIDYLNLYTQGNDRVRVVNTRVNEPEADGDSRITLEDSPVYFNLGMTGDRGELVAEGCTTAKADPGDQPACTADGASTMTFHESDLNQLDITALANATVYINACTHVDVSRYRVEDNGRIFIDGKQELP